MVAEALVGEASTAARVHVRSADPTESSTRASLAPPAPTPVRLTGSEKVTRTVTESPSLYAAWPGG